MTLFDLILVISTFIVLSVAVILLGYKSRWWPFLFAICIYVAFVVLCIIFPISLDTSAITSTSANVATTTAAENAKMVPVYIIILGYSIMFLVITMVCGSVLPSTTPGNTGRVGIIIIAFTVVIIAVMPAIYVYYRVYLIASAIATLGILLGSSIGALWSMASSHSKIEDRKYGSQTLSHLLYYLSLAALITTASNCNSVEDIFALLTTSVLATATATAGIIIESNTWGNGN